MSTLIINNAVKPSIIYQEINKQETIDGCSNSYLTFSLTGNGTFPLSMISNIEPGGGYVRLSTTNNIINHLINTYKREISYFLSFIFVYELVQIFKNICVSVFKRNNA